MISGVFENVEGTTGLAASVRYWADFGYRPVAEGTLSAEDASALYGHASPLRSIRLQHGDSHGHGVLRLLGWDTLRNEGLGLAPPLTVGGRWFIVNAGNIFLIHDIATDARDAGAELLVTTPGRTIMDGKDMTPTWFDRRAGVREMMLITPDHRQAFFARYNYVRQYGTIDQNAPMLTSEATHTTIIPKNGDEAGFYTEALGIPLQSEGGGTAGHDPGSDLTLMVEPGQGWKTKRFLADGLAMGRMIVQWPLHDTPDLRDQSRPGSRGLCLATFHVDDVAAYQARVGASRATEVTPVLRNEFGEESFSFVAPDGFFWTIVGGYKPSSE